MSVRRLVSTSTAMAVVALALAALAPDPADAVGLLAHAQDTVDTRGVDALLVAAAGVAAWAVWAWGALGLALTALSAAPGLVGAGSRLLLRGVLPAGARRSAALALGVGLSLAGPVLLSSPVGSAHLELVATTTPGAVPDWPSEEPEQQPEQPPETGPAGDHVVVRGDCLWDIAAERLEGAGAPVTNAAVADAVRAWWTTNAAVIGPDPDLVLPGQVLRAPQP